MEPFEFRKATKQDLEEVFRLRYKVYCEEWGFERPMDYPDGLESDAFDEHSAHFLALAEGNQIVGTMRLIFNSDKGFPIEKHCTIERYPDVDRDRIGEISRLAVSKDYRRRVEDRYIYEGADAVVEDGVPVVNRRRRQEIICGLYKRLYVESKLRGITHWYAVMAPGLFILLRRLGITFQAIGPEANYHGMRTPYIGCIEEIEREVLRKNKELFKEFSQALCNTL
ncbi:MAG: PEP-CTERM/exosortase system-associated acyltransferase [Nitrospirales bacterium]|nr:PEP-CTERM/exosortase system-associated acyltransferase [Nitrospirales bacterium]